MSELANRIKAKSGEVRANAILLKLAMDAVDQVLAEGDLYTSAPLSSFVERLFAADKSLNAELVELKREFLEQEGDEWAEEPRSVRLG